MKNSKPINTLLTMHFKLSANQSQSTEEEEEFMKNIKYASVFRSLMYFMVNTRPDLVHAVGIVSRFIVNPSKKYWKAVKWILRYLRGTCKSYLYFGVLNLY